jgi:hypothetical protein
MVVNVAMRKVGEVSKRGEESERREVDLTPGPSLKERGDRLPGWSYKSWRSLFTNYQIIKFSYLSPVWHGFLLVK